MNTNALRRKDIVVPLALIAAVAAVYMEYKYISIFTAFWTVALGMSVFYGAKAASVFNMATAEWTWSQYIHQAWFNFVCSFAGWVAAFYLSFMRRPIDSADDYFMLTFALVAVTGHLPLVMSYVVEGIKDFLPGLRAWMARVFQKWF